MPNEIATQNTKALSFMPVGSLDKYIQVDAAVNELLNSGLTGMALTVAKIAVVKKIESALDDNLIQELFESQGKPYFFKTDGNGTVGKYPIEVIKKCAVQARLFGAELTGNEINILGGNMYLTKEYTENIVIRNKIWNEITLGFSKQIENSTWVVPVKIQWIDPRDSEKKTQQRTLDIPVNKFSTSKEDTLRGQAKRDAYYWLIQTLRGEPMPFGEVSTITVESHEIKSQVVSTEAEKPKEESEKETEKPILVKATKEQQKSFDKFISNKEKYKDVPGLFKRAKIWCDENKITSDQLDLVFFNKIKTELVIQS